MSDYTNDLSDPATWDDDMVREVSHRLEVEDLRKQLAAEKKKTQGYQTYALELASLLDQMVASIAGQEDGEEAQ